MIVADDGIWRGSTVAALIQLGVSLGAKRILVAPLLARVSPTIASQLESLHSVQSVDGTSVVDVCYAFPLLLPVPYYGVQECPYETTVSRIRDRRGRIPVLARIGEQIVQTLEGHTPADCAVRPSEYRDTWTRLRTYVELASEDEIALEKLQHVISSIRNPEELLAMFNLFAEEWRLLGRSRLRQVIWPALRQRAIEVAVAPETAGEVRIAAITALRSLFKEAFVSHLPEIAVLLLEHRDALARVILQTSTLAEPLSRREECIHFFQTVSDWSPAVSVIAQKLPSVGVQSYFELVAACKVLLLNLQAAGVVSEQTDRSAAIELWEFLRHNPALGHKTRPFLEILAENTPDTLRELGSTVFDSYFRKWKTEHEPLLTREALPRVKAIHHLLLRTGTEGTRMISRDLHFLEHDAEVLENDLATIFSGLTLLRDVPSSAVLSLAVIEAARRLSRDFLGRDSVTLRLLKKLRTVNVQQLVNNFEEGIKAHFAAAHSSIEVTVEGLETVDRDSSIFAAPDVLAACADNVVANLHRHAFPNAQVGNGVSQNRVTLVVEQHHNHKNEPIVVLRVKNNGQPIKLEAAMGTGGARTASDLAMFGGEYSVPGHTDESPWRVAHRISFLLW